jgi:hypothetical protein
MLRKTILESLSRRAQDADTPREFHESGIALFVLANYLETTELSPFYRPMSAPALGRFLRSLSGAGNSLLSSPGQFRFVGCLKLLHRGDTSRSRPRADLLLGA